MAKYEITAAAGMGYPGPRGIVRPGDEIVLKDTTEPSINCMVPLDEAAFAALKKAKEKYVAGLEEKLSQLDPPQKLGKAKREQLLFVKPVPEPEKEQPADADEEDEGETLAEVGRKVEAGATGGKLEPAAAGKGRASDSK